MSRSVRVFSALLAPAVTVPVLAQAGSAVDVPAPPSNPGLPGALDIASSYHPQTVCDPAAKPGVTAFARLMSRHYAEPNYGISRNCNSGLTEHSEGRALDWMLDINNAQERAVANSVVAWLVAPDSQGRPGAMARRFGIMYIIWNRQIWGAYSMDKGWRAYSGASPHTDHIHFSFSWDGALQKTSWWTGKALTSETTSPGSGAGPITVPTSYTTLQQGDHGTDVMLVQRAVGVSADGVFGPATAAAVRAWQSRHGLPASGTVTAAMWDKLIAQGKAPSRDTSTTTPDAPSGVLADYFSQTLRLGSTGAAVEALQKALGITVDGVFGEQTAAAVSAFQKSKKLGIDGVVGPNTWRALDGSVVADKDKDTADKDKDKDDKGKDSDSGSGADLGRWS
ncbi:peptidoglycan-binding protein, partial [Marihabitans asiaticum]